MTIPSGMTTPEVIAFLLVLTRLSGLFLLAPVFSSRMLPVRIKIMVAMVLALMLTPLVYDSSQALPVGSIWLLLLSIGKELAIGLLMGFAISIIFSAVQMAASFIDTSIGFSMAMVMDPTNNAQGAVMGAFYSAVATLIFLAINGHYWLLMGFKRSFEVIGLDELPHFPTLLQNAMGLFAQLFTFAFQIAAPVLVTLLLVDVVLGIVARVVPQMNVFFVGIPLKLGIGLAAIIIALPAMTGFLTEKISDNASGAPILMGVKTSKMPTGVQAAGDER